MRSRGAICVFPQERPDPIWVSERLTRKIKDVPKTHGENDECSNDIQHSNVGMEDPRRP